MGRGGRGAQAGRRQAGGRPATPYASEQGLTQPGVGSGVAPSADSGGGAASPPAAAGRSFWASPSAAPLAPVAAPAAAPSPPDASEAARGGPAGVAASPLATSEPCAAPGPGSGQGESEGQARRGSGSGRARSAPSELSKNSAPPGSIVERRGACATARRGPSKRSGAGGVGGGWAAALPGSCGSLQPSEPRKMSTSSRLRSDRDEMSSGSVCTLASGG